MRTVGTRFLLPFAVAGILFSAFILYRTYEQSQRHAEELVGQQAALATEFNLAIREYAARKIRPVMEGLVDKDEFIPETMSTSFISRSIFEEVQKKFPNCVIRFSSDNPRNPLNRATPDELTVIEYFRKNPKVGQKREEIQIDGRRYIAVFTPKWMEQECLRCHGDPRNAPAALLSRYGTQASFYRKVGDVAGLDTVAVPVELVTATMTSEMRRQSTTLMVGLILLFGSVIVTFRQVVTRRLRSMAEHMQDFGSGQEGRIITPIEVTGNDEISVVGNAYNKLAAYVGAAHASLEVRVAMRTGELAQANEALKREVEDRRRAEEALKESEGKYRALVETTDTGFVIIDGEGRVLDANDEYIRLTGHDSLTEILGRRVIEWTAPHDLEENRRAVKNCFEKGFVRNLEIDYVDKEGNFTPLEIFATVIQTDTGTKIVTLCRDISERARAAEEKARLEEQLRHAQKMEAIGILAGGVAHDFNNLLTVIFGFANLIQMSVVKGDRLWPYAEQIVKSSNKAADLTRSLLAFSRKQRINLEPRNVNEVVTSTVKLLRRLLPEDIEVTVILTDRDVVAEVDVTQIDQILMNLATNARDAMPSGGPLTIGTAAVTLDETFKNEHGFGRPGRYVQLSVSDTGAGMDQETMRHIFEPFFTTKEVGKGTGLGLASVYGIVKQHGGYISVSSKPLVGTTFNIYLPQADLARLERPVPADETTGGSETVLVVEDDQDVREMITKILRSQGYATIEATNGVEAVNIYKENRGAIDVIILDVVLPAKNGKEVFNEIVAIDSRVRAIFVSGYTGDIVLDKGIQSDNVDFLQKPLSVSALLAKLREVLDR